MFCVIIGNWEISIRVSGIPIGHSKSLGSSPPASGTVQDKLVSCTPQGEEIHAIYPQTAPTSILFYLYLIYWFYFTLQALPLCQISVWLYMPRLAVYKLHGYCWDNRGWELACVLLLEFGLRPHNYQGYSSLLPELPSPPTLDFHLTDVLVIYEVSRRTRDSSSQPSNHSEHILITTTPTTNILSPKTTPSSP